MDVKIRYFDVLYELAPVIGFHVISGGADNAVPTAPELDVAHNTTSVYTLVLGLGGVHSD